MPIAVLSEYTEKEYEPFDPYSRFYPAMPISVCFSDTALYTLGKPAACFYFLKSIFLILGRKDSAKTAQSTIFARSPGINGSAVSESAAAKEVPA